MGEEHLKLGRIELEQAYPPGMKPGKYVEWPDAKHILRAVNQENEALRRENSRLRILLDAKRKKIKKMATRMRNVRHIKRLIDNKAGAFIGWCGISEETRERTLVDSAKAIRKYLTRDLNLPREGAATDEY